MVILIWPSILYMVCKHSHSTSSNKKFPSAQVYLDACLTGLDGHFGSMVYALDIPFGYNNCHLEMLNIVVALKIWAGHWRDKKIQIHCDNMAVVKVLNTGRTRTGHLCQKYLVNCCHM